MSEHPKANLRALEKVLGVDLSGDAEVVLRKAGDAEGKVVRIKSIGAGVYDIAVSAIAGKPMEDLRPLADIAGMDLSGDVTVSVSTNLHGAHVNKELRIKSIGAGVYDITVAAPGNFRT